MFTKDRDDSRKALRCFVGALINETVTEVTVLNNDVPLSQCINDKNIRLDLNCKLDNGQLVDIEMQMQDEYYNHGNRLEYYLSRLVSSQENVDNDYGNLRRTYQIMITNFTLFDEEGTEEPFQWFKMRNESGKITLTNPSMMNVITLELPKIKKPSGLSKMSDEEIEKWVSSKSLAERWCMFLKWANKQSAEKIVECVEKNTSGINEAKEVLMELSRTDTERELARMRNRALMDYTSSMNANYKRGIELGIQQGIQQGMQHGIQQGILQAAKLLKQNGISIEIICSSTGLSKDDIQNL